MARVEMTSYRCTTGTCAGTPYAHTPAAWVTLGFNEDLDEATAVALEAMLRADASAVRLDRHEAVALASAASTCGSRNSSMGSAASTRSCRYDALAIP